MKTLFIGALMAFAASALFADGNSPVGKWAKDKIGSSDYFLEIDDTVFKYSEKKGGNYIAWSYRVDDGRIMLLNLTEHTTSSLNHELYEPIVERNENSFAFSRSGDKMTIFFNNKGVKFITAEAKQKKIDAAKGAGALFGIAAGAMILKEATDTVATEEEARNLADKIYDAAW